MVLAARGISRVGRLEGCSFKARYLGVQEADMSWAFLGLESVSVYLLLRRVLLYADIAGISPRVAYVCVYV